MTDENPPTIDPVTLEPRRHRYMPHPAAPVCRWCGREREHATHWIDGKQT